MTGTATYHVSQLNFGLLRHPADDPRSAGFSDNVARVNAVAERSKGFVWRCTDEAATLKAEGISLCEGDPCAICTMSVWESAADLDDFVHRTVHGGFLMRREEWFRPQDHRTYVIWPVAAGHIPGFREALDRLAHLQEHGDSDHAFGFEYLPAVQPKRTASGRSTAAE